jgi:hypothetical protein
MTMAEQTHGVAQPVTTSEAAYGGFADAIGGIATVVLAIIALSGVHSDLIVAIATIIFGAALLIHAGSMLSDYTHVIFPSGNGTVSGSDFAGGSLAVVFLVGAAGIILGVLALLGLYAVQLTAIAVIAFGTSLVLSSNAIWHLYLLKRSSMTQAREDWRSGSEILAGEMASGSAGMQALAGLAAAILGILAVVGTYPAVLTLVALLILGASIVLTGGALSGAALSFMRPNGRPAPARTSAFGGTAS